MAAHAMNVWACAVDGYWAETAAHMICWFKVRATNMRPLSASTAQQPLPRWPLDMPLPKLGVPHLAGLLVNRPRHAHDSGVAYINHPGAGTIHRRLHQPASRLPAQGCWQLAWLGTLSTTRTAVPDLWYLSIIGTRRC